MFRRSAFTLLELMMVLSLIALLASVAIPTFSSWRSRLEIDRASSGLIEAIADAKFCAVREGVPWSIEFSSNPNCLKIEPAEPNSQGFSGEVVPLPDSTGFVFLQADTNEQVDCLRVSAQGNIAPVVVWLTQNGQRIVSYRSDRLTGGLRRLR